VVSAYDDPALDVRWTYAELRDKADRLARALIAAGVEPGQAVAVWGPNVAAWLVAEFAIAKAAAVMVPLNPAYREDEVRYALTEAGAVGCLLVPEFERFDLWNRLRAVRDDLPNLRWAASLTGVADDALPSLADFVAGGDDVPVALLTERAEAARAADVAQIQFTSGTTGRPKGARLTHHSIVNNARQSAALWRVAPGDRWCNPLPLFHTAGCAMLTLGAVAAGATHLPLVRFDADKVLETIEREQGTILEGVPTMLAGLVERQRTRPRRLDSLRLVGTSGAPTPERLGREIAAEWRAPLRVLYGSTEVAPTVSGTALDAPDPSGWTTVGPPLPWTEVQIVDTGSGTVTPLGVPGELQVRGYQVMAGYHNRPDATREAIAAEGWFRTGDLAAMGEAGVLRIVGRLKDIVIRGGENLYPAEIEDAIRGYPDVTDAAVIGVPDRFFGEEACAVLTVRTGARVDPDQLRSWLAERISHQKVPRYVVTLDELPKTASGKVKKYLLRESVTPTLTAESAP
jgi:fatty-acyl-CoA synthase